MAEEKTIAKLTKDKVDLSTQVQLLQSKMKAMEIELKEAKAKAADAKSQIDTAAAAAAGKAREVNHGRLELIQCIGFILFHSWFAVACSAFAWALRCCAAAWSPRRR